MRLPFLEDTTPPPFYQTNLTDERRTELDKWFIGGRSQAYYLKRFAEIDKAGRLVASWHWAGFVMAFGWLLYRKRYLDCFVYLVAGVSFIKLTMTISLVALDFVLISKLPADIQMTVRIGWAVFVWLFWAWQVGRWSNAYYYRMARREIADALAFYPYDKEAQKAHLEKHGGVSMLGLSAAFGLFFALLWVIAFQFVPIVATQKEHALIYDSYQTVSHARQRVEAIYQTQGCPVGLPLTADNQKVRLEVLSSVEGVATDCVIRLTVQKANFPVRYLNGKTLVLYRLPNQAQGDGAWRCQSSLNKKSTPKSCVN